MPFISSEIRKKMAYSSAMGTLVSSGLYLGWDFYKNKSQLLHEDEQFQYTY